MATLPFVPLTNSPVVLGDTFDQWRQKDNALQNDLSTVMTFAAQGRFPYIRSVRFQGSLDNGLILAVNHDFDSTWVWSHTAFPSWNDFYFFYGLETQHSCRFSYILTANSYASSLPNAGSNSAGWKLAPADPNIEQRLFTKANGVPKTLLILPTTDDSAGNHIILPDAGKTGGPASGKMIIEFALSPYLLATHTYQVPTVSTSTPDFGLFWNLADSMNHFAVSADLALQMYIANPVAYTSTSFVATPGTALYNAAGYPQHAVVNTRLPIPSDRNRIDTSAIAAQPIIANPMTPLVNGFGVASYGMLSGANTLFSNTVHPYMTGWNSGLASIPSNLLAGKTITVSPIDNNHTSLAVTGFATITIPELQISYTSQSTQTY